MNDVINKYLVSEAKGEVRELEIFVNNDADIYKRRMEPIIKNLMTKKAQGKYKSDMAVKAFMYAVEDGAKKYASEYANANEWNKIFPKNVRTEVAKSLRDDFEEEAEDGNYDEYIPKKYQKK